MNSIDIAKQMDTVTHYKPHDTIVPVLIKYNHECTQTFEQKLKAKNEEIAYLRYAVSSQENTIEALTNKIEASNVVGNELSMYIITVLACWHFTAANFFPIFQSRKTTRWRIQ